jgi:DNA replicative helicase MCM subunit Mcm2 (Cdc46/Mcm family)
MFAQSQTNAMLASSQQLPVARRPTGRGHVDLTERIVDPVAQKVKEDFLHFLQHFREDREYHAPGADPTGQSQLIGAVSSSMPFPTSDLLTPLEASPRARPGGLGDAVAHYVQLVHNLINDHGLTLYVDFSHLLRNNHVLANAIVDNFYRFEPFLREAVHDLVESISPTYVKTNNNVDKDFWASFYNLNSCYKYSSSTKSWLIND